jgi:hypothetical protein
MGLARPLAEVARIAVNERCHGIHWEVLDWNTPAVNFYKALAAEFRDEWKLVLLTGKALEKMAEKAS